LLGRRHGVYMARRTTWRIPVCMGVEFYCGERAYSGTVTNISEKGMFIATGEKSFPDGSQVKVSIPLKNEILSVPGRLIRSVKKKGNGEGIAVALLNPPEKYLEFVENLLYIL